MQYSLISTFIMAAATFVGAVPMPQNAQSITIAIAQNQQFSALSAASPCDPATLPNACVDGDFAQCVNGAFANTGCSGGLQCFSLPLVNSVGSSVTCTTPDDAAARMGFASVAELNSAIGSASGAGTGTAVAGNGNTAGSGTAPAAATTSAAAAPAAPATGSIASQSIPLAIAKNQSFKSLSAGSACTTGESGCIGDNFSQCVDGQFGAGTPCAGGLKCFALPLVNSVGTSVTCDTPEDAAARMGISVAEL